MKKSASVAGPAWICALSSPIEPYGITSKEYPPNATFASIRLTGMRKPSQVLEESLTGSPYVSEFRPVQPCGFGLKVSPHG